jgi:hypothetical protein
LLVLWIIACLLLDLEVDVYIFFYILRWNCPYYSLLYYLRFWDKIFWSYIRQFGNLTPLQVVFDQGVICSLAGNNLNMTVQRESIVVFSWVWNILPYFVLIYYSMHIIDCISCFFIIQSILRHFFRSNYSLCSNWPAFRNKHMFHALQNNFILSFSSNLINV